MNNRTHTHKAILVLFSGLASELASSWPASWPAGTRYGSLSRLHRDGSRFSDDQATPTPACGTFWLASERSKRSIGQVIEVGLVSRGRPFRHAIVPLLLISSCLWVGAAHPSVIRWPRSPDQGAGLDLGELLSFSEQADARRYHRECRYCSRCAASFAVIRPRGIPPHTLKGPGSKRETVVSPPPSELGCVLLQSQKSLCCDGFVFMGCCMD